MDTGRRAWPPTRRMHRPARHPSPGNSIVKHEPEPQRPSGRFARERSWLPAGSNDEILHHRGGDWHPQVITLPNIATVLTQPYHRLGVLHTFGNHGDTQLVAEIDYRANY